jgi:hypothetical protein
MVFVQAFPESFSLCDEDFVMKKSLSERLGDRQKISGCVLYCLFSAYMLQCWPTAGQLFDI